MLGHVNISTYIREMQKNRQIHHTSPFWLQSKGDSHHYNYFKLIVFDNSKICSLKKKNCLLTSDHTASSLVNYILYVRSGELTPIMCILGTTDEGYIDQTLYEMN